MIIGKEYYKTPEVKVVEMMTEGCVLSDSVPTLNPGESEDGSWGEDL